MKKTMLLENMDHALSSRRQGHAVHKDVQDGASNEWLEPVSEEQYQKVR